ncbi:hypothetical protein [Ruminococcus sp. NK3A76]|uniref:hypothetical protein n=1 Tax=Ruminococcus sp. NK3A76 TaxID=877411 RepID=UPI0012EC9447|nr:hypothetical protein [Ruminococcus sp. NK3A76]
MKTFIYPNDTSYYGDYGTSDNRYYYTQNGILNIVEYPFPYDDDSPIRQIKIYTLDKNMKLKSTKSINFSGIESYEFIWGGFYHAYDGSNYVVVGNNNHSLKKGVTVIKVIKYSKDWKKLKTLNIKSDVTYTYDGIYEPFAGGSLKMDASGNKLFIYTCRQTFPIYDRGIHQTNIAFEVNTDTMKLVKYPYNNYTSHSFNQFVKFKDNTLYLADHGDGYPRGVKVVSAASYTGYSSYGKSFKKTPFAINGGYGENYTGTTIGGMEIGQKNIITVGSSVPHNKTLKSIKGYKKSYNHNVYVIATDRETGKSTFKWLTKYNPKTSGYTVNDARLVKVTDNRFAVIYNVTTKKTGKKVLHCVYIDGSGNVIKNLTYKTIYFDCKSQPIMYNGYITFEGIYHSSTKKKDVTRIIRLPAQV